MQRRLASYDNDHTPLDKEAPDYREKLQAWAEEDAASEKVLNDALCEVLYAAHYKLLESYGGYAVDHAACELLNAAIEAVLEAMPTRAKARFDKLMERPGCAS